MYGRKIPPRPRLTDIERAQRYFYEYEKYRIPIRKVYLPRISRILSHKLLKKKFSAFGEIENLVLKQRKFFGDSYAFITYYSASSAARALVFCKTQRIFILNEVVEVVLADFWHQPERIASEKIMKQFYNDCAARKEENSSESLIDRLNDDCMYHIFSYLSIMDRLRAERVCKRWLTVSLGSWHSLKYLDFQTSTWKGYSVPDGKWKTYIMKNYYKNVFHVRACDLYRVLVRCGKYLTVANFEQGFWLTGRVLIILAKLSPNLRSIYFNKAMFVSPLGMRALARNCRQLRDLKFRRSPLRYMIHSDFKFHNHYLTDMLLKNRHLRNIDFNFDSYSYLQSLPHNMIRKLAIRLFNQKYHVGFRMLEKAHKKFRNLTELRVELVCSIGKSSHLQALKDLLDANSRSLTTLVIRARRSFNFQPVGKAEVARRQVIESISGLVTLRSLTLKGNTFIKESDLISISKYCQLTSLAILYGSIFESNCLKQTLVALPKLEHLYLKEVEITDDSLVPLPNLRSLRCKLCPKISPISIRRLLQASDNIDTIVLSECMRMQNDLLYAANRIAEARLNKVPLTFYIYRTGIYLKDIKTPLRFIKVHFGD